MKQQKQKQHPPPKKNPPFHTIGKYRYKSYYYRSIGQLKNPKEREFPPDI